jgi:hypothetical protein
VGADGENLQVGKVIVGNGPHLARKTSSTQGSGIQIIFFHVFAGYDTKDSCQI